MRRDFLQYYEKLYRKIKTMMMYVDDDDVCI